MCRTPDEAQAWIAAWNRPWAEQDRPQQGTALARYAAVLRGASATTSMVLLEQQVAAAPRDHLTLAMAMALARRSRQGDVDTAAAAAAARSATTAAVLISGAVLSLRADLDRAGMAWPSEAFITEHWWRMDRAVGWARRAPGSDPFITGWLAIATATGAMPAESRR